MRYSLSNRFRGILLGAAIGDCATPKDFTYPGATKQQSQVQRLNCSAAQPKLSVAVPGGRLAILGAESLIRLGRFDLNDWHDAWSKDSLLGMLMASSAQNVINCLSTAIIGTLPIALFYHENEIKLRQNLQLVVAGQDQAVSRDGALAVGYAITQCLNEKLNAATLIPQIITFLGEPEAKMAQHLRQVQTLLVQRASLARAVNELSQDVSSTPIALAFYCFLSTLEDFRLSVMRAALTPYQPQITSAIAAALSGAYNSTSGIPLNWRLVSRDSKLAGWGITAAEILQISDLLVAVWSGVYSLATHPTDNTQVAAIAAPRVIRPR